MHKCNEPAIGALVRDIGIYTNRFKIPKYICIFIYTVCNINRLYKTIEKNLFVLTKHSDTKENFTDWAKFN